MTASSPWYGNLFDLLGKALPAAKELPSSEWSNNPDFQRLTAAVKEGLQQRPDPDAEQGKLLGRVDQMAGLQNSWQKDSNRTALDFGKGTLDLRGTQLEQNLGVVTRNRDNTRQNIEELDNATTRNEIDKIGATARYSMMPVNAYADLVRDQDRNSLAGLDRTLAARRQLQQDAFADAERQARERNSVGSIVKDLVRSLPAAAAFFVGGSTWALTQQAILRRAPWPRRGSRG